DLRAAVPERRGRQEADLERRRHPARMVARRPPPVLSDRHVPADRAERRRASWDRRARFRSGGVRPRRRQLRGRHDARPILRRRCRRAFPHAAKRVGGGRGGPPGRLADPELGRAPAPRPRTLASGTKIGSYEVLAKLGAGGMGEVYRARDTTLNRDVAIKVLPDLFASDPERLARFSREAQTLASLNHPNIAAIYGVSESPGVRALVMELVVGEDLSALVTRGPLPLADVLPIATQLADALEAAHEQGIVHRDPKPANIKIRADGTVKVLDFGLAKAMDAARQDGGTIDPAHSPTLTARATQMGTILGTAAYMAPEQARGKAVDRRADIWAFGVVLFELLTGRRAFEGDDVSITLASVLKEEVKWDALPPDLPPPIRRVLRRCLEKDPKKRLSSMGDARLELDEQEPASAARASAAEGSPRRTRAVPRALLVVAGLWLATLVPVVRSWLTPAPAPLPTAFTLSAPLGEP